MVTAVSTCQACGRHIILAGGMWTDDDWTTNCLADLSAIYTPHKPVSTAAKDTLLAALEDAIEYRRPDTSVHCGSCIATVADRCDDCARDEARAGNYRMIHAVIKSLDAETVAALLAESGVTA